MNVVSDQRKEWGPPMNITTLGIDLGKNVFHLHGVDEHGKPVVQKRQGKCRDALASDPRRPGDLIEHRFAERIILGKGFDLQHLAVGGKADGPQGGQVVPASAEGETAGVIDRGLGV